MKQKTPLKRLIDRTIQDPELKQLFLTTPELVFLQDAISKEFQAYEEQIRRYQERLQFNLKDTHSRSDDDIRQLKALTYKAYHDTLTGLPNRTYIYERIEAAIMQAHRHANPFAIMFIDLDGFKNINDNYGHDFGDKMLQLVAERLRAVTRETDMVARLAGDEFCVHLMNLETASQSARVAEAIINGFKEPIKLNDREFSVNLSIGISHYPMDGQTTKQLMKNADIAMYEAKNRGTNLFQFYEQRLTEQVTERLEFEKDLSEAIKNKDLSLTFKPFVDLANGQISAIDIGMFWQHEQRGKITSDLFYHGIANNQIIMNMLHWQISECCRLNKNWLKRGYKTSMMRIYLDPKQFFHKELFHYLTNGIDINQYPNIELIISESSLQTDADTTRRILVHANKLGFKTGIDLQGSGFLPINLLSDCSVNSITIQHHSLTNTTNSEISTDLINGMKCLSKAISVELFIDGVTNNKEQKLYLSHEITNQSGVHFAEQQNEQQFETILQRFRDSHTSELQQPMPQNTYQNIG